MSFTERLRNLFTYHDQEPKLEDFQEKEVIPVYPCGYRPCTNKNLVITEIDDEVMVFCDEHQARTYWKKGRPDLKRGMRTIRPEWSMDIHSINKK